MTSDFVVIDFAEGLVAVDRLCAELLIVLDRMDIEPIPLPRGKKVCYDHQKTLDHLNAVCDLHKACKVILDKSREPH